MKIEHILFFGIGQCFAHQSADALTQRVVESFDVVGQTGFFAHFEMRLFGDAIIGPPKVAETPTAQILVRQLSPQTLAGLHRTIPDIERENLAGTITLDNPYSYLIDFQ